MTSTLQAVLAIVGALLTIATLGGGVWAVFKNANLTTINERQSKQLLEYIARIDYIEPRWKAADEKNAILSDMYNPAAQLGRMEGLNKRALELLEEQRVLLDEIAKELHRRSPRDDG